MSQSTVTATLDESKGIVTIVLPFRRATELKTKFDPKTGEPKVGKMLMHASSGGFTLVQASTPGGKYVPLRINAMVGQYPDDTPPTVKAGK